MRMNGIGIFETSVSTAITVLIRSSKSSKQVFVFRRADDDIGTDMREFRTAYNAVANYLARTNHFQFPLCAKYKRNNHVN